MKANGLFSPAQYRAWCVSWGLLVCVRACSSRLSPDFRLRCRFSADTSAVFTAPTVSRRIEDTPTSMPAFYPEEPDSSALSLQLCLGRQIKKTPPECSSFVVSLFLLAAFPGFIYSRLCLVRFLSLGSRKSGSPALALLTHFFLSPLLRKKSHKMIQQFVDWPFWLSPRQTRTNRGRWRCLCSLFKGENCPLQPEKPHLTFLWGKRRALSPLGKHGAAFQRLRSKTTHIIEISAYCNGPSFHPSNLSLFPLIFQIFRS